MATILCFGDSNTWGMSPSGIRYNENQRWSALLAKKLINKHTIIEAGQPNRTLVYNAPFSGGETHDSQPFKSGIRYLKPYLIEKQPDLILIMLGTNDLKKRYALTVIEIGQGLKQLVKGIFECDYGTGALIPKILIISPPPIFEVGSYVKIYAGAEKKSKQLAEVYAATAKTLGCAFFDAGTVAESCSEEGVHWQVEQHSMFAEALAKQISNILIKTI